MRELTPELEHALTQSLLVLKNLVDFAEDERGHGYTREEIDTAIGQLYIDAFSALRQVASLVEDDSPPHMEHT